MYDIYPIEMVEQVGTMTTSTTDDNVSQTKTNVKQKEIFGFKIKENAVVNEDLLEELSIYHPKAQVDSDGNITVFHRTSKENADKIHKSGIMTAKEDALYFSSKESGYASDYGDTVITLKIPSTKLRVNDIFDGEVHFDLPLKYKNGSFSLDVSKYLIESNENSNYFSENDDISNKNYIAADRFGKAITDFTEGKITADEFNEIATKIDESRTRYLDTKYKKKHRNERKGFKPYSGSVADLEKLGKRLKDLVGSNYDNELLVNELGKKFLIRLVFYGSHFLCKDLHKNCLD